MTFTGFQTEFFKETLKVKLEFHDRFSHYIIDQNQFLRQCYNFCGSSFSKTSLNPAIIKSEFI